MERYAHVTAAQQRQAADLLEAALARPIQSVTQSVTAPENRVASSRPDEPKVGVPRREVGSGGRIRTYDQAVNSRPLYH